MDEFTSAISLREQQRQWRSRIPRLHHLVEHVGPEMFKGAEERRLEDIPEEWKTIVDHMRTKVHSDIDEATYHDPQLSLDERRGYWSCPV